MTGILSIFLKLVLYALLNSEMFIITGVAKELIFSDSIFKKSLKFRKWKTESSYSPAFKKGFDSTKTSNNMIIVYNTVKYVKHKLVTYPKLLRMI